MINIMAMSRNRRIFYKKDIIRHDNRIEKQSMCRAIRIIYAKCITNDIKQY